MVRLQLKLSKRDLYTCISIVHIVHIVHYVLVAQFCSSHMGFSCQTIDVSALQKECLKKFCNFQWFLRATASKYGESHDSSEISDFFFLRQKDPFGELFSEIYFQSSSEFTFL